MRASTQDRLASTNLPVGRTIIAFLIVGFITLISCGPGGPKREDIALEVAQEWTSTSVATAATMISEALIQDQPTLQALAASLIEDQIRQNVTWDYATPTQLNGRMYEAVATATTSVSVDIPILGNKGFEVSGKFILQIDTDSREVTRTILNMPSFTVQEL